MALTKLDPNVIGQDSTGTGKITSAGGSVSIDSSGNVRIANSSANNVLFAANGNVGIGNTTPTGPLSLKTSNTFIHFASDTYTTAAFGPRPANDSFCSVLFYGTPNTGAGNFWKIDTANNNFNIVNYASGSTRTTPISLDGVNGRLGIGTQSPSNLLHVAGSVTGNVALIIQNGAATANDGAALQLTYGSTEIGSMSWYWTGSQFQNKINYYGDLAFTNQGTERVRFLANGNVGINQSSPTYKMEVNGSMYAANVTSGPYIITGNSGNYQYEERTFNLTVTGNGTDSFIPVSFYPRGGSANAGNGNWRGEIIIGINNSTSGLDNSGGYNGWVGGSAKYVWDCGHWNAKPNIFLMEYHVNLGNRCVGQHNFMTTTSQFILWLYPCVYTVRIKSNPGTEYYTTAGGGYNYYNSGSTYTASALAYASRNSSQYDSPKSYQTLTLS